MLDPKPQILLVDDDPTNLFILEELMIDKGYNPVLANSGKDALAITTSLIPDLVLLDVMMPDIDGFEVCYRLRQNPQLQTVPILFLTALDDEHSQLRGLESMGDDYLTKPFNSQLLLTKIDNILHLSQMRKQQCKSEIDQQLAEQTQHQLSIACRLSENQRKTFQRFVPEQYLHRLAPQGIESIELGKATEAEITVCMCDIREFTTIAESQSAFTTLEWLNAFFTQMNQVITAHHGFIDKFIGDALLAVFDRSKTHAADALDAAVEMQQRLEDFNRDRYLYQLELPLKMGIGIHTGIGIIGTLGCTQRMSSTVIGDVVNTAARLEELTKLYECSILASGTTIAYSREGTKTPLQSLRHSRWIDRVNPRGKRQKLDLYDISTPAKKPVRQTPPLLRRQTVFGQAVEVI